MKSQKLPKGAKSYSQSDVNSCDLRLEGGISDPTISKSHYTRQGEHPEDRIYRDREYIHRLRRHMDEVYDTLEKDLGIVEDSNWLFDFVHNEDRNIEFEEYLSEHNVAYADVVGRKNKSKARKS